MSEKYEICIRLSEDERNQLDQDARQCGLSKTAYVQKLIMGKPVRARPSKEICLLRQEIHAIGNNVNQIGRSVNAGIATPADAEYGLRMLDKVYELMSKIAFS